MRKEDAVHTMYFVLFLLALRIRKGERRLLPCFVRSAAKYRKLFPCEQHQRQLDVLEASIP
jgi:hypothetical protein